MKSSRTSWGQMKGGLPWPQQHARAPDAHAAHPAHAVAGLPNSKPCCLLLTALAAALCCRCCLPATPACCLLLPPTVCYLLPARLCLPKLPSWPAWPLPHLRLRKGIPKECLAQNSHEEAVCKGG
jgi:hypothetical protein